MYGNSNNASAELDYSFAFVATWIRSFDIELKNLSWSLDSLIIVQLIQSRLSFQKRRLWTMSAQVNGGPDSQGITFVASKFAV